MGGRAVVKIVHRLKSGAYLDDIARLGEGGVKAGSNIDEVINVWSLFITFQKTFALAMKQSAITSF